MSRRGRRRYSIEIQQHDGTANDHGHPSYEVTADWDSVIAGVPASRETVSGGETLRGVQVTAETTDVFVCDWSTMNAYSVTPEMRLKCDGQVYGIITIRDANGLNREAIIEARREL